MSLLSNIPKPKIYLDANALFSAAFSERGGARLLCRLAEFHVVKILTSPSVLSEADQALRRKAPHVLGHLAILLDAANCQVVDDAPWAEVESWNEIVGYGPDAGVVAAAIAAEADYLVTLDRRPSVPDGMGNKRLTQMLPLVVGTPGDCLAWLRTSLISPYDDSPNGSPAIRDHRLNEPLAAYRTRERS